MIRKTATIASVILGAVSLAISPAVSDEPLAYNYQGVPRTAFMYKPGNEKSGPLPLMIVLHGRGEKVDEVRRRIQFDNTARRENFIVVYPEAIEQRWNFGRAATNPTPSAAAAPINDVEFIRMLIDDLASKKIVDRTRVYVAGVGRGGLMAFTLACALPDHIAGAAPLLTGMMEAQRDDCHPSRPMPLVLLAGTNDFQQWYDGRLAPEGRLLSIPETAEFWRVVDKCKGETAKFLDPHREIADQTRIRMIDWTDCDRPGLLRLYRINGGGHQIPSFNPATGEDEKKFGRRNLDIEAADEIWDFLKRHSL
jgi:polyhydroxybutyrate depolymerase